MTLRIVEFYAGKSPDHRGRFVNEIQNWSDERLEDVHDFIQWLFPLPEPSPVNPLAPVIDRKTAEEFAERAELRMTLRKSFERMLRFYGFEIRENPVRVEPAPNFEEASENWLLPGNHNHLRITRILRSIRLLGLPAESQAFLDALRLLYQTPRGQRNVTRTTWRYWEETSVR